MITCPHCKATTRQVRVGISSTDLQKYRCEHCYLEYSVDPNNTVTAAGRGSQVWGRLPELVLLESLGLLIVALAFAGSRAAASWADPLLWAGLAFMILPVAIRLASAQPSRRERIALVLMLGMSLYLAKYMHSPAGFTFPDELTHMRNANEVVETSRLFQENPVQPVTALYPGLPTVTVTLSAISGLPVFSSGLLVIGAARLLLFLALFLLFERISNSARVAGIASVLYMSNPNFLYWTAEYAYEPLALPLLAFVLLMVVYAQAAKGDRRWGAWTFAALLGMLTVIITHHMSSYILVIMLGLLVILFAVRSVGREWGPWQLAVVGLAVTVLWLNYAASLTVEYLSPVLGGTFQASMNLISEEQTSRTLFTSSRTPGESVAPVWERYIAMFAILIIAMGIPPGAVEIGRSYRSKMFALMLAAIAIVYLPIQTLRLTSEGWETANRSSEFLFIGIGFVLAVGVVRYWLSHWNGIISRFILAGLLIVLFFGGLIAGWPPRARQARPYSVDTGGYVVRPQVISVAEWMQQYLGNDNRVATSKADAKVLGAYGQYPFTDNGPVKKLFLSPEFGYWERHTLLKRDIEYVVSDRKTVSWDHMIGYYFYNKNTQRLSDLRQVEPDVFEKFEGFEGMSRVMDSGDIVIYDVEAYLAKFEESEETTGLKPVSAKGTSAADAAMVAAPDQPMAAVVEAQSSAIDSSLGCLWTLNVSRFSSVRLGLVAITGLVSDGSQLICFDWSAP